MTLVAWLLASSLERARHSQDDDRTARAQDLAAWLWTPVLLADAPRDWPGPRPAPIHSPTPTASSEFSPSPNPMPSGSPTPSAAPPSDFEPFGTVRLQAEMRLEGAGDVIDSLAFWEAPDPADSLLLVTAKGNGLVEVWRLPFEGNELASLDHASLAGGQVNGIAIDQGADRLYVAVSRPASTVAVFELPSLSPIGRLVEGSVSLGGEPNLTILHPPSGDARLYVSADMRVHVLDPRLGEALGDFETAAPLENMVADFAHQRLYIPDEVGGSGVYAYDPEGRPVQVGGRKRFGETVFEADAEGIILYRCRRDDPEAGPIDDGRGWIVVADQKAGSSDFEVFDRRSWTHLGRLQLDGVARTDGLASIQQALPGHPAGLFAAVNDDRDVALVGWDAIIEATGLRCDR